MTTADDGLDSQRWLTDLLRPIMVEVAQQTLSEAFDQMLASTITMVPGTVALVDAVNNAYQVDVDGDSSGDPAHVQGLVEPGVAVGDRVMVIYVPPHGAYIIGSLPPGARAPRLLVPSAAETALATAIGTNPRYYDGNEGGFVAEETPPSATGISTAWQADVIGAKYIVYGFWLAATSTAAFVTHLSMQLDDGASYNVSDGPTHTVPLVGTEAKAGITYQAWATPRLSPGYNLGDFYDYDRFTLPFTVRHAISQSAGYGAKVHYYWNPYVLCYY